jgi:single-strand DNA-binding protein
MAFNQVILIGRICNGPETKFTPAGAQATNFRLAVDRPFKNAAGERETDFIDIVTWRKTAEFVSTYLGKGRLVCASGRLQVRQWQTQDGQKRQAVEVVAENVQPLDRKPDDGQQGAPRHNASPADDTVAGDEFDANMDISDPFAD